MNVKPDNQIYNLNIDLASLEVIYLINEKNKKIKYVVFDVNHIPEKILKNYIIDSDIQQFVKFLG